MCFAIDFTRYLLTQAYGKEGLARFLCKDRLEANSKLGGVRIEDNVVVTADGCDSFTQVPRTVEDIEAVMAGRLEWTAK